MNIKEALSKIGSTAKKKRGKNKKYGRNKRVCEMYLKENRRLKNKVRKLKKHIKHQPNDTCAIEALMVLE